MEQDNTQITEEKLGFFEKMYKCIYDMKTYAKVLKETTGRAVLYILLMTLIFGGISLIADVYEFNTGYRLVMSAVSKVPEFSFENGTLTVDSDQPYKFSDGSNFVFIMDTTGATDKSALENYTQGVLITSDQLTQKQIGSERTVDLTTLKGMTLNKADLIRMMGSIKSLIIGFMIIGAPIAWFVGKLLLAFILVVVVGLIANSINNTRLSFGDLYKLALYSLTAPIILGTLMDYLKLVSPTIGVLAKFIYFIVAAVYLILAISYLRRERVIPQNPYGPGYPNGNGYNGNWNNTQNYYGQQNVYNPQNNQQNPNNGQYPNDGQYPNTQQPSDNQNNNQ